MIDFNKMTTEELTDTMEMLERKFEETSDPRTRMVIAETMGSVEAVRDLKSWN